jgi:hypothetical protein
MQFSIIQARVAQETGLSTVDDATMIKAWINGAYQQLSGFFEWPWLLTNFTMQTEADITNLTASVNAANASVTLNVAPTPATKSLANFYMIQFTDTTQGATNDWYLVSAHTANTTAVTISVPYVGITNYTAGTCTIRRVFYSLPTNIDRLRDLRQSITKLKIELIDSQTFDKIVPDPNNTGTPTYAYLSGMVGSGAALGAWQLSLYPLPSAVINIQGRGYITVTELSADGDIPLLPVKWHNALVFLALALYGHDYIDDTRVQSAMSKSKEIMTEMLKEFNPFPGELHVIQPWDTRTPRGLLGVRLPSNYPWPWGV